MSVSWTKEQQQVIRLRDRNILVSAAAGSGKTAVLVERIIAMLTDDTDPIDVDRLLIVTFTEAAAAEMKERIRDGIEKKLEQLPDNEHLKQQEALLYTAHITTIHSFCLSVIRDHFSVLDIDPGFRIGEEGEIKLLKHDVLEAILEENYDIGKEQFLRFIDSYAGGRDDKKIEEFILKLYEYSRSYPDSSRWLSACVDAYGAEAEEELEQSSYMKRVTEQIHLYVEDAIALVEMGLSICEEADGPLMYCEALWQDQELLRQLLKASSYSEYYEITNGFVWAKLKANRDKTVSEEKTAMVKRIRDEIKAIVKEIKGKYFVQNLSGVLKDMAVCKEAITVLSELVQQFAAAFDEKKRNQNLIDFGDMEQYALRILTEQEEGRFVPSAVAKEYQQQFHEIMIDEYQDSNLVQETILTSVSTVEEGRKNIFMVGDVKQSIYRFRLSRPELFMEKFHTYSVLDSPYQRIDLHKNFRSRGEVLDSVNYFFAQLMTSDLGGITYDGKAALYAGAQYESCGEQGQNLTEVMLIEAQSKDMEKEENGFEKELEARAIAIRIRKLLKTHIVRDKKTGKYRNARYSDIVILTRSVKGFVDIFSKVLNEEGIPTCAGTKEGYFSTREIGVLLDYLRVLNNQRQDIPLAAVLTSSIGGLTEEDLAVIKSEYREISFCQAVAEYALNGENGTVRNKLSVCLYTLEKLRRKVPYMPMHELLWSIMEETGYEDYVSALPGGEQRKANLDMLVEKARVFEATSYKGLFHFVRYIEQLQKYDVDYGEAGIEDEQSDTVRIMTIHKSKGLEFPIVIAAGMGKRFNMQDARSAMVLHSRLGVGLDAVNLEQRTKSSSFLKKVIQKEEALDNLAEELRVLYVAFTRAREKLIITGTLSDVEKKLQSYQIAARGKGTTLSFGTLSKAVSCWDWILPVLERGEAPVAVSHIRPEDLAKDIMKDQAMHRLTKSALEDWDTSVLHSKAMEKKIEEEFAFQYPYRYTKEQKLKFTVSELKKRTYLEEESGQALYEEEIVPLIPEFLKEKEELTGASRGSAYHRLMELLDFTKEYKEKLLNEEIERFCQAGKMSKEMAACIDRADILTFLSSSLGERIRKAARRQMLRREQPFVLGVDAAEVYPEQEKGEWILVQGIIDVYFEEDGLIVLDYKTDQVRTQEELVNKYSSQLEYYAKALEQLLKKPVKEKLLYSFTLQQEVRL